VLDRLGWYEILDRDATITSTRQAVATNPALIRSQPPFSGSPAGIDEQTGMYTGSDPFVLYEKGVIESINVVILGDVGGGKEARWRRTTTSKTPYTPGGFAPGG
jgi:hypothetical protein